MIRVIAIVPAFNEEDNIEAVIEDIRRAATVDMVVIDDGSTDRTADIVRRLGAPLVSTALNLGIGGAVQTGFKYAVREGYDIAVQVDGDGQHDASQIDKLIQPILDGSADVVIGSRYIREATDRGYSTPLARRLGMILFSLICSAIVRQRITDATSGFRALNRRAVEFFAREYPTEFPDAEAIAMLRFAGFTVEEIPVTMRTRTGGQSSLSGLRALYYPFRSLLSLLVVLLRRNPARGGRT